MVSHFVDSYYLATFTTNNVTDGSVTFSFNGTSIWLYGAKRSNHGSFVVQVDSQTYANLNGEGNNVFQQPLFNTTGLGQGMHTVKLTNTATGSLYVDIDMVRQPSPRTAKHSMSHRLCGNQRLAVQTTWSPKQFKIRIPAFNTKNQPGLRLLAIATSTSIYLTMAPASEQLRLDCFLELIILI